MEHPHENPNTPLFKYYFAPFGIRQLSKIFCDQSATTTAHDFGNIHESHTRRISYPGSIPGKQKPSEHPSIQRR